MLRSWFRTLVLVCALSLLPNADEVTVAQDDSGHAVITPENVVQVEQLAILGFGTIYDVAWSPDDEQVAVASSTGILLYDSDDFDTAPYEHLFTPQTFTTWVAYSPDGRLLAGVSRPDWWWLTYDDTATIHIWDAVTHDVLAEWDVELPYCCPQLEFSPDSQALAIYYLPESSSPGELWDISTLPDIQLVGTPTYEEIGALWHPLPNLDQLDYPDLTGAIITAASRDLQWVAAYDGQGVIHVWDIEQEHERFSININELEGAVELGKTPRMHGLSFSPASSLLLVSYAYPSQCGNGVGVWDAETGVEFFWHSACNAPIMISPDEQNILRIGSFGMSLSLWDRSTQTTYDVLGNSSSRMGVVGNFAMSLAFSPDSTKLAMARNNLIEIWNVSTQARITSLGPYEFSTNRVAFSVDGKVLAVYGWGGAWFYDMETFQEIASLEVDQVYDISFSPNGRWLAAQLEVRDGTPDHSILTLWEVDPFLERGYNQPGMENTRLVYLYGANMYSDPVAFSPDSSMLAGMGVNRVFVWDVQRALDTEEIRIETPQNLPEAVIGYLSLDEMPWQVAFSPDGHSLAIDNVIYDTETWNERVTLTGHTGTVTGVAFSPDGSLIATSSGSTSGRFQIESDNTVRLWDAQTGEQLTVLQGHSESIRQIVFSPDGRLLASGSGAYIVENVSLDGTVRLWGVP